MIMCFWTYRIIVTWLLPYQQISHSVYNSYFENWVFSVVIVIELTVVWLLLFNRDQTICGWLQVKFL